MRFPIQDPELLRYRYCLEARANNKINIKKHLLINFSSNDYLNLATHPKVKQAFIKGVAQYGAGSAASALVSGFYKPQLELETAFAEFLNREKALLFNSGYLANIAVATTLGHRANKILADKLCHASIIDGIRLSRASFIRYQHNDVNHLKHLLTQSTQNCLVYTESVFSMEGVISPIHHFAQMVSQHHAHLIVDDAHGVGILGKKGGGISEYFNLNNNDITCLVTPLGKAFSSMGAIVSGKQDLIEALMQSARTYCYTTALPPALACQCLTTLKIVQQENWRREKLIDLIRFFNRNTLDRSLKLLSNDLTPIRSILIEDQQLLMKIKATLMRNGFFVSAIRPPTVPKQTARMRISLNCAHTESDIIRLLDSIADTIAYESRLNA